MKGTVNVNAGVGADHLETINDDDEEVEEVLDVRTQTTKVGFGLVDSKNSPLIIPLKNGTILNISTNAPPPWA